MRRSVLSSRVLPLALGGDAGAAEDALCLTDAADPRDPEAVESARALESFAAALVDPARADSDRWYEVWRRSLRFLARSDFRSYMQYLELDRPPEECFWMPRRVALDPVAQALQDIADGRLDELFLSMPPRVGKSGIVTMFCTWVAGMRPERSNLYSSYSSPVTKAFYNGLLEVMRDPYTYRWQDVFPTAPVVSTDANDETICVGRRRKYATLTCRSIDGTLNGACDASGVMVGDDLCSGYEEAINDARMEKLNAKVANDWLSRRKQGCAVVWVGTRWSVRDPIGTRQETLERDPRFSGVRHRSVVVPALDEADHSNFVMPYGVGFSSEDYQRVRAQFERQDDMASWLAMYQQQPVERQGALFDAASLREFDGEVPKGRVFMAVDPAFGGGDYTAAPVCVDTGEDVYVPAVVFSDAEKDVTMPMLAEAARRWGAEQIQFEANRTLASYVDEFRRVLRRMGVRTTVTTQPAPPGVSKDVRIHGRAPDIRQHFVFLSRDARDDAYERFMRQVCAFTSQGKVAHDDAPDSLAMAAGMVYRFDRTEARVFRRPF